MRTTVTRLFLFVLACGALVAEARAETGRYRLSWRDDPATTMTIGFEFVAGREAYVALGERFGGTDPAAYPIKMSPARTVLARGMRTCFVRLSNLKPATVYHFIVVDDQGVSRPMSFETAPNLPNQRLSIIAGGDSRNHREARRRTNALVAKLRPHAVFFNGDMTNTDSPAEWKAWLDDWQLTASADGRLYPIVVARGNHERDNEGLADLFDTPSREMYYALHFGGNLLSLYTLNSLAPAQGAQLDWLNQESQAHANAIWKVVQYHNAMRPHTRRKLDRDDLVKFWAPAFYQQGVQLVIESDAHVAKQTYPIRRGKGIDADEGFVRDDLNGTVYVGEGGWGAPLRPNDDDKSWTQASGRFNQVKWLWVSADKLEVRTIMTEESGNARPLTASDRFRTPPGLQLWQPVGRPALVLRRLPELTSAPPVAPPPPSIAPPRDRRPPNPTPGGRPVTPPVKPAAILRPNGDFQIRVEFTTTRGGPVEVIVITSEMNLFHKQMLPPRGPGPYREIVDLPEIPRGIKWQLVVKSGGSVIQKYLLHN